MFKIDSAIITFCINDMKLDLEVPTFVPIHEVRTKIREIIANISYKNLTYFDNANFYCNDNKLDENMFFAQLGIWEGCLIDLKK